MSGSIFIPDGITDISYLPLIKIIFDYKIIFDDIRGIYEAERGA